VNDDPYAPLRADGWGRLLAAARRRLEQTGGSPDGSIGLRSPSDAERRIVIGITGSHRSANASHIRVPLRAVEAWLRRNVGAGLTETLTIMDGRPLDDRAGDRRRETSARDAALALAMRSRHASTPWYEEWLASITRDGTLTRIVRRGGELAAAVTVLDALPTDARPAEVVPLPVLAEQAVGDTKALSGTPLAALVLRALALRYASPAPSTAEEVRTLWEVVGVIVDDLASQVLVLNMPATGGALAGWLSSATREALPFRVTLQQLMASPVVIDVPAVYVCENPAVLRAAATVLGAACAPLVCTEGVPSVACSRLLEAAGPATIHWRNDLDWPGLRMTAQAIKRFGALPWRMSTADYLAAADDGAPLTGTPVASPWDDSLAEAMREAGRSVMEERLLSRLLADLDCGSSQAPPKL
jgi:uncharacterized protein (TIGR02679 family)